jgi:hypothetical protein
MKKPSLKTLSIRSSCAVTGLIFLAGIGCGTIAQHHGKSLFNGKTLDQWREPLGEWQVAKGVAINPTNSDRFVIQSGSGTFVNGAKGSTVELISKEEFGDMHLHVEFCIPKHSNSGVYLMGRYEIQIYDSFGVAKDKYPGIECGGIYGRWINEQNVEGHSPRVNASKPAGEWQSFDVTFRAPRFDSDGKKVANAKFVKVIHNGKVIHENVEVTGATRSGFSEKEKPVGPIRLQGNHGPVAFRNIWVKELSIPNGV